jgi:hypothetical protein
VASLVLGEREQRLVTDSSWEARPAWAGLGPLTERAKPAILPDVKNAPPDDTDPKIGAMLIEGYRRMPGWQRLERMGALNRMARELALADIRRRHPDDTPRQQLMRLGSRWLDADTMRRVFGWDPELEGR